MALSDAHHDTSVSLHGRDEQQHPYTDAYRPHSPHPRYVLLADNTVENYTSTDTWTPGLYDYQTAGANTLFFTFIDPTDM